jgi:HD-GYP domain-containing protein (c-di-GMP phosphodiesterase class II)
MRFPTSLRFRLPAAIVALFVVLAVSATYTLYLIDFRQHDYAILNLSGQLRVISHDLKSSARQFLSSRQPGVDSLQATGKPFLKGIQERMHLYDQIIQGFKKRQLSPELTGRNAELKCSWDKQSRNQLDLAAQDWDMFQQGYRQILGNDTQPDANAAALYVRDNASVLMESAKDLTTAFQRMMEHKLATIRLWNRLSILAGLLLMGLLLFLLYTRILKPLERTMTGFKRVTNGEYGHQVAERGHDELTAMIQGFNALSSRLNAVFRMTERINRGLSLQETMETVCAEFRAFVPLDWATLVSFRDDGCSQVSVALGGEIAVDEASEDDLTTERCLPDNILNAPHPVIIDDIKKAATATDAPPFAIRLASAGLCSAMVLPLNANPDYPSALVLASRSADAYRPEDQIFMESLAGQVGRIIDRTVIAENLVVATVEGLARLAENRDPETGDHLIRMSMYASFIASSYIKLFPEAKGVDDSLPRQIRRFASMHDIGKVGVQDSVLLKAGKLNEEEWKEMVLHPTIGGQVLRRCEQQVARQQLSIFGIAIEITECHHEKYDGSGYPDGLKRTDIPLSARIVAAADVFDALTSKRPYKEPWPVEEAIAELEKDAGSHFDPDVIAAFKDALPRILKVYDELKHV